MARVVKYLGYGKEAVAYGTEAAAVAGYIDVDEFTPNETIQLMERGGVGSSSLWAMDHVKTEGSMGFSFPCGPENGLGWLLGRLLGLPTSTVQGATAAYKHTYLSDDALGSITFFPGSADLAEEVYVGQVLESIKLDSGPDAVLKASIAAYGAGRGADNTIGTPSFSTLAAFRHRDLSVKVDTVEKGSKVGPVSVSIENAIEKGKHTAGSALLQNQPKHTVRAVTGSIELPYYDAALRTAYNAGTPVALILSWVGALCATGYYYTITVTVPKAYITKYDHPVKGRETEPHTFEWKAIYDATTTAEVKVEITNLATTYA